MKHLLAAIILLGYATGASALDQSKLRVIDGDTVQYRKTVIRLVGFDTPETRVTAPGYCAGAPADLGKQASATLQEMVAPSHRVTIRWAKGKDKYGRGLAHLYSDGKDVGPVLISRGLAKPYDGRTKQPWC
jgi:micrococcal nuclease